MEAIWTEKKKGGGQQTKFKKRQRREFVTQEGDMIYVQNLRVLGSHFFFFKSQFQKWNYLKK